MVPAAFRANKHIFNASIPSAEISVYPSPVYIISLSTKHWVVDNFTFLIFVSYFALTSESVYDSEFPIPIKYGLEYENCNLFIFLGRLQ